MKQSFLNKFFLTYQKKKKKRQTNKQRVLNVIITYTVSKVNFQPSDLRAQGKTVQTEKHRMFQSTKQDSQEPMCCIWYLGINYCEKIFLFAEDNPATTERIQAEDSNKPKIFPFYALIYIRTRGTEMAIFYHVQSNLSNPNYM